MSRKFIHQNERMANLSSERKKELAELEKSGYQIEEYQYFSEPQGKLIDWAEHVKTLDKNIPQLIIKPNEYRFKDNKLVLKDFPNLTTIYAVGLGLEEISLANLPQLQNLNLTNNKLKEVGGLEQLTSLTSLVLSKNVLESFEFGKNINLGCLILSSNNYYGIKALECQGLKKLEYLDCSFNRLRKLNVEDCENLKVLDADGNSFDDLNFPELPNLENLSLLNNLPWGKKVDLSLCSPNLKFLVIKGANIRQVYHRKKLNNELQVINKKTYKKLYKDTEEAIQAWEKVVDETVANSCELDMIRHLFGDTHIDHDQKEKEIEQQLATEEKENQNPPITDSSLLENKYPDLIDKQAEEVTLTHKFLTETLIVENYPNLKSLNVGNNYLSYLVVRNCPKLEYLRYAHNKLKSDCFIENCLNLKEVNKENYHGKKVWDSQGEELFNKGELKPQVGTFYGKPEKKLTKEQEVLNRIAYLLIEAQQALNDKNYTKLSELLTEIKELIDKVTDTKLVARIKAQINKFKQALLNQNVVPKQENHWPLIISSIIIPPLTLGIFYLLTKKWVKQDFQKQAVLFKKKKKQ